MAALTGLCTLCHFDLNFFGIVQIVDMHAKAAGSHLLDGRRTAVAVRKRLIPIRIFTALAAVGLPAQAVHGNGKTFMGFLADGAIAHRAGLKPLDDAFNRFDLIDGDRFIDGFDIEQAANGAFMLLIGIHLGGIFLIQLIIAGSASHLQFIDGFRIEHMIFAAGTPLMIAARFQCRIGGNRLKGFFVPLDALFFKQLAVKTADTCGRSGKIFIHKLRRNAECFEYLRALIGLNGGYAHFGSDFNNAFR